MARIARVALTALITMGNAVALGADALTTLSIGADYSSGNYGLSDTTRVFYLPVTAKHEAGRWVLKLVVPYIRITGPSNVVGAPENQVILPNGTFARRTESGLGDVVASAFYNVFDGRNTPLGVDLGAKVKFGTGDPAGVDLRNVVYGTIGSSYRMSQPTTVGLAYDWRDRIVQGGARVSELTAYISRKLSSDWKLQVYAVKGFTNGSPDFGAGSSLAYSF